MRNDSILQLFGVYTILLDVLSTKDELESVFDLRLCPTLDEVGNLPPLVAHVEPLFQEVNVLLKSPLLLVNGWVQGGKPSLPALLTVPGCVGHLFFACSVVVLNVVKDCVV